MKLLWVDTETTGLDPVLNDIISLCCIIQNENNIIEDKIYLEMCPYSMINIDNEALNINGYTYDMMFSFQKSKQAFNKLLNFLDRHKEEKYIMAGYNVSFDFNMIYSFFNKSKSNQFSNYFDYHKFDIYSLVMHLKLNNKIKSNKLGLRHVCKEFGIFFDNHNAEQDTKACMELYNVITPLI